MADSLVTRPSLLLRIRDAHDQEAWRQFVRLYAPLVYRFARKRGLQDADAADLSQDVLGQVARSAGRFDYDPERGTFRSWLFQVVRNRLSVWLRGQRPQHQGSGDTGVQDALEQQPALDEEIASWDREYEQRLFACAAQQVQGEFAASTWQAFWQTAIEGKSPKEVAEALRLSVGAVYIAKSRVVARLTQQIQELQS